MKREAVVLALAMVLPSAMAYVYFVALASPDGGQTNRALLIAYPTSKVIQFLLPLAFVFVFGRTRVTRSAGQGDGLRQSMIFGFVVAIGVFIAWQTLCDSVLIDVPNRVALKVAEFGTATPPRYLALAAFLSFVHSLFEEYYWRWFIHARLRQWLSFGPAATLSSLAFASHHLFVLDFFLPGQFWSAAVPFTLGIAIGGAFWAWLFERSGSLIGPWISHMIVDATIMAVGYKMVFLA